MRIATTSAHGILLGDTLLVWLCADVMLGDTDKVH